MNKYACVIEILVLIVLRCYFQASMEYMSRGHMLADVVAIIGKFI